MSFDSFDEEDYQHMADVLLLRRRELWGESSEVDKDCTDTKKKQQPKPRIVSHEQPKQKNKNLVKQQNCKTKKEKTQSDEMKLKASRDRAQDRKDYDVHG